MLVTGHGMDTISLYKTRLANAVECLKDMHLASGLIFSINLNSEFSFAVDRACRISKNTG